MNLKSNKKSKFWCIPYVMLTLLAFFLGSCDDGKEVSPITGSGGTPFNPAFPIRIDSIYPKAGSAGQRVLIYGENFGNNPSQLEVYIGGQKSSVVNVKSTYMYCLMPSKAYEGDIQVTIKDGEKTYTSEKSDVRFEYQRLKVVSTLLGEVNPQISDKKKNFEIKDGPFDNCGGVANPCFMKWDPENPELLYFAEDTSVDPEGVTGSGIRCIDFGRQQLYTILPRSEYGGYERGRSIDFFKDKDGVYHMVVATSQANATNPAVYMFDRVSDTTKPCGFKWSNRRTIVNYNGCACAAIHPQNGDLYFTHFQKGHLYRVKKDILQEFVDGTRTTAVSPGTGADYMFTVQDKEWEFNIIIHPTGNYAYLMVINKHYILRSDYNGESFTTPYVVAGSANQNGYVDAVGNLAKFDSAYQGVFVKNDNYKGEIDEYDFYIADKHNHAIRILTPLGQVSTFAGRGSASLNSNPWGYVNGDLRKEARFERPKAIAYDEKTGIVYVGDAYNHRIRKIALEEFND